MIAFYQSPGEAGNTAVEVDRRSRVPCTVHSSFFLLLVGILSKSRGFCLAFLLRRRMCPFFFLAKPTDNSVLFSYLVLHWGPWLPGSAAYSSFDRTVCGGGSCRLELN